MYRNDEEKPWFSQPLNDTGDGNTGAMVGLFRALDNFWNAELRLGEFRAKKDDNDNSNELFSLVTN